MQPGGHGPVRLHDDIPRHAGRERSGDPDAARGLLLGQGPEALMRAAARGLARVFPGPQDLGAA